MYNRKNLICPRVVSADALTAVEAEIDLEGTVFASWENSAVTTNHSLEAIKHPYMYVPRSPMDLPTMAANNTIPCSRSRCFINGQSSFLSAMHLFHKSTLRLLRPSLSTATQDKR